MFCSKPTVQSKKNIQKKINNKIITISNAPVFHCSQCNETFLSPDVLQVIAYIREQGLDREKMLFTFDEIFKKMGKLI